MKFNILVVIALILASCDSRETDVTRPVDPWAFRSVVDKKPRMLTLALDTACYVAYDLQHGALYKVWKGGILLEGTVYTDKKNVQPTTWGTAYYQDNRSESPWQVSEGSTILPVRLISKGYLFRDSRVTLNYHLVMPSGDTIFVSESPEFVREEYTQRPGLERIFETSHVPSGVTVQVVSGDTTYVLKANGITKTVSFFDPLPKQSPPGLRGKYDHLGKYWIERSDCLTCHEFGIDNVGPSFARIANRYENNAASRALLTKRIIAGGSGVWGSAAMTPHPDLSEKDIQAMLDFVFTLKTQQSRPAKKTATSVTHEPAMLKPGFGAPVQGVHPAYDIQTLHPRNFNPRVGGLAFLRDGGLLVTTWDSVGGVYLFRGVETGDTTNISIKRIAAGLAEPLGIEVVDGEIYVLQKHELTHLIDHDNDEVIDEYRAVCNTWGVTGDFHEFAFGLVYKEGYFYATLSMAMRLMDGEQQLPDRGRTIRIGADGQFEWVNYGLRTPNGIGIGPDQELFVTDNQGQWLPANKLIHVRDGTYNGMAWGLPDTLATPPPMTPPAIWLPDGEIGNSPSEPILMQDGPYKGQMLHGDVTNGGIKRDYLEKVNGAWQGAVFRFSQGFEAGVNRLAWGPDGALYVGGVGMVGGWSWQEKRAGLQRMKYNGKSVFEMLSVKAKPAGFDIVFTEALAQDEVAIEDWRIQQWWYLPTENYGGPKLNLENLKPTKVEVSSDRKKVYLEIPGLKKEHVVYFRLPEDLRSASGQSLWAGEAWYTLNHIPTQ